MVQVNNLSDLFKEIQKQIDDSLKHDVAPVMVDKMREHVQKDVYDAYHSSAKHPYQRTGQLLHNVNTNLVDKGTLEVTDERVDHGRDVTRVIETGKGYDWPGPGFTRLDDVIGPRPFIKQTIEDVKQTRIDKQALKKSLNKKGFDVK